MRIRIAQRKLRSIRRQRLRDVVFTLECMGVLLLSAIALHLIGLKRWTRILARSSWTSTAATAEALASAQDRDARPAYAVVEMACRNVPRLPTCLPRAVTLRWALSKRGLRSELQFAVRKRGDKIEAHASVVCGNLVFYDGRREGYEPFPV